jgi:CRP-like cAMP-binding protein
MKRRNTTAKQPRQIRPDTRDIDPYVTDLLQQVASGKTLSRLQKNEKAFSQGDAAEAIFFIQTGKVKITVVSSLGKEAVLSVLGPRAFFGEGCLVGQTLRLATATAIQASTLVRVERGPCSERFSRNLSSPKSSPQHC